MSNTYPNDVFVQSQVSGNIFRTFVTGFGGDDGGLAFVDLDLVAITIPGADLAGAAMAIIGINSTVLATPPNRNGIGLALNQGFMFQIIFHNITSWACHASWTPFLILKFP